MYIQKKLNKNLSIFNHFFFICVRVPPFMYFNCFPVIHNNDTFSVVFHCLAFTVVWRTKWWWIFTICQTVRSSIVTTLYTETSFRHLQPVACIQCSGPPPSCFAGHNLDTLSLSITFCDFLLRMHTFMVLPVITMLHTIIYSLLESHFVLFT